MLPLDAFLDMTHFAVRLFEQALPDFVLGHTEYLEGRLGCDQMIHCRYFQRQSKPSKEHP